ncbi:MAG: phosphoenolpyruvate--protein phosphotransferase, partial [Pseudonocardiaceae bacterium]
KPILAALLPYPHRHPRNRRTRRPDRPRLTLNEGQGVQVTTTPWVSAANLSTVLTLGALPGHEIEVQAVGPRAWAALDHVLALAAHGFDDPAVPTDAPKVMSPQGRRSPIGASPGIGIGPAWSRSLAPITVTDAHTDDPATQWRRLTRALATVRRDIQRLRTRVVHEMGEADGTIFDTHLLLLDDADLMDEVRSRVDAGQAAAAAWSATITRIGTELDAIPDPYLHTRAADLTAVGDQVLRALLGVASENTGMTGVLLAADLTPAQAAGLDRSRVAAVILAFSSPTAHSVILLRARGIPAVVAAGPAVLDIPEGTPLAVDGTRGEVIPHPPPNVLNTFKARAAELADQRRQALTHAASPATTRDGVGVLVGANIGSVEDARAAVKCGADLAGLVRTEFLFLGRTHAPDVDEQEAAYRDIAHAMHGRRITLRTLDAGGDKQLDYLPQPPEANPFLGVRGIRLSRTHPGLLADQLLAIVRLAHDTPVSLLFPMISTLDELRWARRMLDDTINDTGRGQPAALQIGIMVEVPATALKTRAFASHVDFLSIGTNDLTHYALAAERGNNALTEIADPFDPGPLSLIAATCRGADHHVPVAVCGELAADEQATALLIGLGVRELSVTPHAVPMIKQAVRGLNHRDATALAAAALTAEGPDAVRELLRHSPRP